MRPALVLLGALALVGGFAWNQYRTSGHERRLGEVAAQIAGRPVSVRCQGLPSELIDVGWSSGEVRFSHDGRPADETTLDRAVCQALGRFRADPSARDPKADYAVHLLAHESWHLRGVSDEAVAECYALQTTALAAERLGAAPAVARAVAVWNLVHAYATLPDRYRTATCANGGPLDLRPADDVWP